MSRENMFWSIQTFGEVLSKLKSRGLRATSLSTYDCSSLYPTQTHKIINKDLDLIECAFKNVHFVLPVTIRKLYSLLQTGARGGVVVEFRTPEREFRGSKHIPVMLCP